MKVQDVITRVSTLLEDKDNVRWPILELTDWINDGQRTIFIARPDVSSVCESIRLVSGSRQKLPSGGIRLLDVVRNMGTDGNTPGNAIRYVDREALDTNFVNWHGDTKRSVVKNYVYDNRYPEVFYVYPPSTGSVWIEAVYTKAPAEVKNLIDVLSLPDSYFESIVNYVMYRAYSKDTELSQNPNLATMYMQMFDRLLGGQKASDLGFSPDLNSKGASPSIGLQAGSV